MNKKARILAVDDELANLKLLKSILSTSRYEVSFAINGPDAIRRIETEPFDVLLLDLVMPDMDGYKVLDRLRKWDRSWRIRVIVLSSLNRVEDKLRAFQLGAVDYVTKPFNKRELLARIDASMAHPTVFDTIETQQQILTPELSRLQQAIDNLDSDPDATESALEKSISRIDQLLQFYQIQKAEIRLNVIIVNSFMKQLCASVKDRFPVEVRYNSKDPFRIAGDSKLLERMFVAMFAFSAARRENNDVVMSSTLRADAVMLTLFDSGPVLSDKAVNAMFDPMAAADDSEYFYDLSLAGAAVIAKKHGGVLICQSTPQETVLTLKMPLRNG
ncbi:hypothetical protein NFHSH190041_26620 [Shewanella sp. NFH-SH190041]|uniref:ATP-binding response regulator n=1 Tax=Shewanella sp. NFH-SH190041 TaxID=2950245 RepID=UPI0021C37FFA|nr:response regulator [Shewanella sp. NFH-SH190041]BDM65210.1 hypothetical protein NFHSH190041_26620 [Shewanella sp. NFH-SH190041]